MNILNTPDPEFLDRIFIRATDKDGHWGSFSLTQIDDSQFVEWVFSKLGIPAPLEIEKPLTINRRAVIVQTLLNQGVKIVMLKPSAEL